MLNKKGRIYKLVLVGIVSASVILVRQNVEERKDRELKVRKGERGGYLRTSVNDAVKKGNSEVSRSEAEEVVRKVLKSYDVGEIIYRGKTLREGNEVIGVYSFEAIAEKDGESIWINISRDGIPVMMLNNRKVEFEARRYTEEEASENGKRFLEEIGFREMTEVGYETRENDIVVMYGREDKGIVVYEEEIKVKVNLSTGEIEGFDASEYIRRRRISLN